MLQKSGKQLFLEGLETAASRNKADLKRAQLIAELLGGLGRIITADDVRDLFFEKHQRPLSIGNAMGHIFSNKKIWECVGRVKSARASSHARYVSQWRLRPGYYLTPVAPTVGTENGVRFCRECGKETEACQCQTTTTI